MKGFKHIFFTPRFFYVIFGLVFLFTLSFYLPWLYIPAKGIFFAFLVVLSWEVLFLFGNKNPITITRNYPNKLSNGDVNKMELLINSSYSIPLKAEIIEELPEQLQIRNFQKKIRLNPRETHPIYFHLRPVKRGVYSFGQCIVLLQHLGLIKRRIKLGNTLDLPCYPSFIQLRKYLLMATTNRLEEIGVKRIRRIGNTLEFERIRDYSKGDEFRFINWKATGKARKLMVNQYEDEKSQPIYSFIDTGRSMRMPFEEMTLLDYAINATLVLSNVSITKHDKAGMLTYSNNIENHVVADKRNHQMQLISEMLYNITTSFKASEFGNLYAYAKRKINQRSLIFLYTNFETLDALYRQMPYLKLLNKSHIIVVIVFKNTELEQLAQQKAVKSIAIYNQIIAEKFNYEKQLIIQELQANGIQTIFTTPSNLTINSINKYLEIKARGII